MAEVRLGRYEAREGRLPPVCMVCAVPAGAYRRKVFTCRPVWQYVAALLCWPLACFFPFLARRAVVLAPLCRLHKHQWRWRALLLGTAVLAADALLVLAVSFLILDAPVWFQLRLGQLQRPLLVAALGVVPPGVLLLALTLKFSTVYATEITEHSVTLTGVPGEFVEAVRVARLEEQPLEVGLVGRAP